MALSSFRQVLSPRTDTASLRGHGPMDVTESQRVLGGTQEQNSSLRLRAPGVPSGSLGGAMVDHNLKESTTHRKGSLPLPSPSRRAGDGARHAPAGLKFPPPAI